MRYFRLPFAVSGTRTAIPDTQPANGAVNYSTGYSSVYQLDPSDPLALRVERAQMNENLYQITDTLRNYFENGIPPFITSTDNGGTPFPYSKDALCKLGGVVYSSNVASNTTTPPGASWTVVDMAVFNAKAPTASPAFTGNPTAPTPSVSDSDTSIATTEFVRNVMSYFGIGTSVSQQIGDLNSLLTGGLWHYLSTASNAPEAMNGSVLYVPWANSSAGFQIAQSLGSDMWWIRTRGSSVWGTWRRLYHAGNSLITTQTGANANGQWKIYSDGTCEIFRNVSINAGFTWFSLPITISNSNAKVFTGQLGGNTPPSNEIACSVTTTTCNIYSSVATTLSVLILANV